MHKFLILLITAFLFKGIIAFAHSGATGPDGCHMNYSNGNYHCHETKTPDPAATYYYIKHQDQKTDWSIYGYWVNPHLPINVGKLGSTQGWRIEKTEKEFY
jgi:hypothetical protein